MSTTLPLFRLTLAIMLVATALLPPVGVAAQTATPTPTPDYQRYVTFHNDFDFPIYPVIQVPADICDGGQVTSVRRILVNGAGHTGLQAQETLTVLIPDEKNDVTIDNRTEVRGCWYQSGRIYIFPVDIASFEASMIALDPNNEAQTTHFDDPTHPRQSVTCFAGQRDAQAGAPTGDCYTGVSQNSFAADVPAQLAEYTFDSDNGQANKDPDTGTPMADIDVSYVDDVYLPVAASVANHGATGYMGSALQLDTFEQRLRDFQANGWPVYSAYLDQNWQGNAFSALLPAELGGAGNPPAPHLPAGYNSIQNTLARSASSLYKTGDAQNYLISGVLDSDSQVQPYIDRWMSWVNGNPCQDLDQLIWPENITASFDKLQFCNQFRATVQDVWNHFLTNDKDGFQPNQAAFYKDCGLTNVANPDENQNNACVIQHIVGYNSMVLGGRLPGEVQALLRGVAYNAQDGAQQYQFDPFLTFDAPTTSQFSLDPYTRLIHSTRDGVAAVAYSFSIDDKYGNFRDASSGFVVDAGGTTALQNKQPYDAYQQYKANWGYNLDKFSLVTLDPGVDLAGSASQLEALAQQKQNNQPFLIKQGDQLAVLGHADSTTWKLTNPLVTLAQLQGMARQEATDSRGQTHNYQDIIDHTFGSSSVFPSGTLNPSSPSADDISTFDFAAGSNWAGGQAILYDFIAQQGADVPSVGNWVRASVCGVDLPLQGPGSQRLPLQFDNNTYQPCAISVTDSFGDSLKFSLTPVSQQPVDSYTGSTVTVWGLPIGSMFSGDPPVSSNLTADDQRACQQASSLPDLCANVTLSATWAIDPLARDVVYMGLDPRDMPRVNVNLPPAPIAPPDPKLVTWPPGATLSTQPQSDGTVLVSWPAARVGAGTTLQYLLYVKNGTNWDPVAGCDQSTTSCRVKLGPSASLYVIAVNNAAHTQTPQLFGCYPAGGQCAEDATHS